DDVDLTAEVVVPDPVEDLRLAQYPTGVAHEVTKQLELRRGQLNPDPASVDLVAVFVEGQVTHDEGRVALGQRGAAAAQQRPQPCDDLLQAERLGHVVV